MRFIILTISIAALANTSGCSWQMQMPPPEMECKFGVTQPGAGGLIHTKVALYKPEPPSEFRFTRPYPLGTPKYLAAMMTRNGHRGVICLWEVSSGRLMGAVEPESALPVEIRWDPSPVAISNDGRRLATCRDQVMQIWAIPECSVVSSFAFGADPIIRKRKEVNGRIGYDTHSAEKPSDASFSEDGSEISAWIGSEQARITWNAGTGSELSRVHEVRDKSDPASSVLAECPTASLSRDFALRTSGTKRNLFGWFENVATRSRAEFSQGGTWLATTFFAAPHMLDFTPDKTPYHVRFWNVETCKLVSWMRLDTKRVDGTIDERGRLLVEVWRDGQWYLTLLDVRSGTEIASELMTSVGSAVVRDTNTLVILDNENPVVWMINRDCVLQASSVEQRQWNVR